MTSALHSAFGKNTSRRLSLSGGGVLCTRNNLHSRVAMASQPWQPRHSTPLVGFDLFVPEGWRSLHRSETTALLSLSMTIMLLHSCSCGSSHEWESLWEIGFVMELFFSTKKKTSHLSGRLSRAPYAGVASTLITSLLTLHTLPLPLAFWPAPAPSPPPFL